MQVPKWFDMRTPTAPMPCALARLTASRVASSVTTWPTPSWPSITAIVPASTTNSGLVTGFMTPLRDAVEIPAQSQHAVRLMAPQVGLHQRIGDEACVGFGHAGAGVDGGSEVEQVLCVDAWR